MSLFIHQTNSERPIARKSMRDPGVSIKPLSESNRLSSQSPFDIINGVAYPRNGFFSIDCVIAYLFCPYSLPSPGPNPVSLDFAARLAQLSQPYGGNLRRLGNLGTSNKDFQ